MCTKKMVDLVIPDLQHYSCCKSLNNLKTLCMEISFSHQSVINYFMDEGKKL